MTTTATPKPATTDISEAIANGLSEAIQADMAATKAPSKKARKPAAKPKAAPKAEPKAEPKAPEAMTYKGFAVAEGISPSDIEADEKAAAAALDSIQSKDRDLMPAYLSLGRFMSETSKKFASTKLFGQYRKEVLPASEALDAALRSNCGWLYSALTDASHEGYNILTKLGLPESTSNDPDTITQDRIAAIGQYKSQNPTVIKRAWRDIKKDEDTKAKAEALGVTEDELGDTLKAEAEADLKDALESALASLEVYLEKGNPTKAAIVQKAKEVAELMVRTNKQDDKLAKLNTLK